MPHFTLTLSAAGPLVDAFVIVSEARRQALLAAHQQVPPPIAIRALLDTGASHTCIDPSVLTSLALTPTGSVLCNTPSSGNQPHQADQYDIGLIIPGPKGGVPLIRPTLPVMESHLFQQQGFHSLIGRDVLAGCVLTFNGTAAFFILAY